MKTILSILAFFLALTACTNSPPRELVEIEIRGLELSAANKELVGAVRARLNLESTLKREFPRLESDSKFLYSEMTKTDESKENPYSIVISVRSSTKSGSVVFDQEAMDFAEKLVRKEIEMIEPKVES